MGKFLDPLARTRLLNLFGIDILYAVELGPNTGLSRVIVCRELVVTETGRQ